MTMIFFIFFITVFLAKLRDSMYFYDAFVFLNTLIVLS